MRGTDEALIVIDVQNDFCPGGALAVAGGEEIIARINGLMQDFPVVVLTQDWHPPTHSSFAVNHAGKAPFDTVEMPYGTQTLWPAHCIWGTDGARLHAALHTDPADLIIRKGFREAIDSYSAFFENDRKTATGLHGYLQERGIRKVTLVGLATDFCVAFSALDAAGLGYETTILEGACRAIDLGGSLDAARAQTTAAGVTWAA